MQFEFTPNQIIILGLVASVLTTLIRVIVEFATKQKIVLPNWVQNIIVFIASTALAIVWMPSVFPPIPLPTGNPSTDVPAYLQFLVSSLSVLITVLSFAVFIYNYLIVHLKNQLRYYLRL